MSVMTVGLTVQCYKLLAVGPGRRAARSESGRRDSGVGRGRVVCTGPGALTGLVAMQPCWVSTVYIKLRSETAMEVRLA
eukprot:765289-Hanusia_phi.AAC.7